LLKSTGSTLQSECFPIFLTFWEVSVLFMLFYLRTKVFTKLSMNWKSKALPWTDFSWIQLLCSTNDWVHLTFDFGVLQHI